MGGRRAWVEGCRRQQRGRWLLDGRGGIMGGLWRRGVSSGSGEGSGANGVKFCVGRHCWRGRRPYRPGERNR